MAAVNIFDELRKRVSKSKGLLPREQRAMFWFQTYANELIAWQRKTRTMNYQRLASEPFSKQLVSPAAAFPGCFYFYLYDPKLKNELPYYDRFPFTLVLSADRKSFLGLNFHYLNYYHRALLFDAIYPFREGRTATPDVRDLRMRIKISYDILKRSNKYRAFRPCIKRYLVHHIQTPLLKVSAHEWDVALFLPVELFVKDTKENVWRDSASKM